jgi:hypothetical protein
MVPGGAGYADGLGHAGAAGADRHCPPLPKLLSKIQATALAVIDLQQEHEGLTPHSAADLSANSGYLSEFGTIRSWLLHCLIPAPGWLSSAEIIPTTHQPFISFGFYASNAEL